jgi:hypothetical protein
MSIPIRKSEKVYLFSRGLWPTCLGQRHDVDEELLSDFIISGITRIVHILEDDELGGLMEALDKIYRWI